MKLQKRKEEDYREKSKRPGDTKNISLERMARGTVTASSDILFQVGFSKKTREYKYNKPKTEYPKLDEEEEKYIKGRENFERKEYLLFRKKDSLPQTYHKPSMHSSVICIYSGDKNKLFPYKVLDMNWNLLWEEK